MSARPQLPIESRNHISDEVLKMFQCWDNRLVFPPTDLSERYLRGELHVLIKFLCKFSGHRSGAVLGIVHRAIPQIVREHCPETRLDDRQFPMFVEAIQVMNDGERVVERIGSVIRLQFANELKCGYATDALYLSLISRRSIFVQRLFGENGKLNPVWVAPSFCGTGELPDDVVKDGPPVMHDLPGENRQQQRHFLLTKLHRCLNERLKVLLTPESCFARLKMSGDLDLKMSDVFIGPI